MSPASLDPEVPSPADAAAARAAAERLPRMLRAGRKLRVQEAADAAGPPPEPIELPAVAVPLLQRILAALADGNAVAITPIRAELTTQQAADLLGVSRPFLIKELERNAIPYRTVGSHRRVLVKDLMDYKRTMHKARHAALDELAALGQEIERG